MVAGDLPPKGSLRPGQEAAGPVDWVTAISRWAWAEPEPELRDASLEGELAVARLRIVIILSLFSIPATYRLAGPLPIEGQASVVVLTVGLFGALIIHRLARNQARSGRIGFISSATDVSLVTAVLTLFAFLDKPLVVTNSQFTFSVYFLALGATALRYDRRVCLAAGLCAILQYAGLIGAIALRWPVTDASFVDPDYGRFGWHTQVARLILLGAATYLSATLVTRSSDLRRLSIHDQLTGLVNRAFFDERLREELAKSQREGLPLTVAMADLDHFKQINDRYGHPVGDAVLRSAAGALRSSLRDSDIVARYGGEEFALILPGLGLAAANERLQRVRRAVTRSDNRPGGILVTLSIGAASWPEDGGVGDLISLADRRLYRAKALGRDRVVVSD